MLRVGMRAVGFVLMVVTLFNHGTAQEKSITADVLALVPSDAVGLLTIRPTQIAQDESLKMFPLEVASAAGLEQLGFDPLKIERIDAIVGLPGPVGPQVAALVSFSEDIPADINKSFAEATPKKVQGLELWELKKAPGLFVHLRGSRQAVVGTPDYVLRLLKTKPVDGELRQLASRMSEPGHLSLIVALEPMRDMPTGFAQSPQVQQLPEIGADVETLAAKTKMIALRVQLGSKPVTALALEAGSEDDAAALSESLTRLIQLATKSAIQAAEREAANEPGRIGEATVAYAKRLTAEIERQLTFVRTGNRLLLKLDGSQMGIAQIGVMTGLLLPAVQAAREAARRMQSSNNLKQIALAMHNYESAYKYLPADTDRPKEGQKEPTTNLSWRVKILPFVEQAALYNEFHHDEPWDSPHNMKLLERMPDVFKHPQMATRPGYTVYQMPTGEGLAVEPGKRLRFQDFTDGTSNTIAALETRAEDAVPWTKPGDVNPLTHPEVVRSPRGIFQAAFMDGSVRALSSQIQPDVLRALLTRNGGEQVPQ